MADPRYTRLSKFLTLLLRHRPDILNLRMRRDGFVDVRELLTRLRKRRGFEWVTLEDIKRVVVEDEKKRFELREEGGRLLIRARYGHNRELPVEIDYPRVKPGEVKYLYHGTRADVLPWILREGLKPMRRKYVHLTRTPELALEVAKRRKGKPVILKIDAEQFLKDGGVLYKATDDIYLAEYIAPKYIHIYRYGE